MTGNLGWGSLNRLNKNNAWKDWEAALSKAGAIPVAEIQKIAPKPEYGWKRIDKCTKKLYELLGVEGWEPQ